MIPAQMVGEDGNHVTTASDERDRAVTKTKQPPDVDGCMNTLWPFYLAVIALCVSLSASSI